VARTAVDSSGKPVNIKAKTFAGKWHEIAKKISAMELIEDISWEQWRGVVPSGTVKWITDLFDGVRTEIREGIQGCPAFQDDVEQYTRLVFECAAACLGAYADFKRVHGLMDFVDQETLTVDLARNNAAFRDSFRQRVKFMVVDEFQDTNPLQLELFLQLSRLVDQVVWVGDPKQAIYEFRGTDPELMNAVVARVEDVDRLDRSWRSQRAVIDLSNAVFEPLFELNGMRREDVHLTIPAERSHLPHGSVEAWTREGGDKRLEATAAGVADLLARRPNLKPCDIAVLVRTNKHVTELAEALDRLGIRASPNTRPLLAAREIQLVRAAMAFIADPRDTLALTELVALHPHHHAHHGWQSALLGTDSPAAVLEAWAEDPLSRSLAELRDKASRSTPGEVFERTVGLLGLPELIKSWSVPATRLRNLGSLRASLTDYYEQCSAVRRPGTVRGFLAFLDRDEQVGAENVGDDVVNVLTYHKAKGLEWPVVVMETLDKEVRARAFGMTVEQDGTVDVDKPLSGRWIRFWPNPFPWGRLATGKGCGSNRRAVARRGAGAPQYGAADVRGHDPIGGNHHSRGPGR
jgi:ATP-dependent helicase/nuclease subunit A